MRKRVVMFILAALLLIPGVASATTMTTLIGGGTLTVGDKLFSDFSMTGSDIDTDLIFVTASQDLNGLYFLAFNSSQFSVTGTENAPAEKDWFLGYSVQTTGSMKIAAIDQFFTFGGGGNYGNVTIEENVYNGSPGYGGISVANSSLSLAYNDTADPPIEAHGDQLNIADPLQRVWVIKDIALYANAGGTISATTIKQSFHQVPEPATLLLLGFGLIGLAGIRRKFKSSKS